MVPDPTHDVNSICDSRSKETQVRPCMSPAVTESVAPHGRCDFPYNRQRRHLQGGGWGHPSDTSGLISAGDVEIRGWDEWTSPGDGLVPPANLPVATTLYHDGRL